MYLRSDSAETGTRNLVSIINDHQNAVNATALYIQQDSTAPALVAMGNVGIGFTNNNQKLAIKQTADQGGIYIDQDGDSSAVYVEQDGDADGVFVDQKRYLYR